jgi:hypothetical protein
MQGTPVVIISFFRRSFKEKDIMEKIKKLIDTMQLFHNKEVTITLSKEEAMETEKWITEGLISKESIHSFDIKASPHPHIKMFSIMWMGVTVNTVIQ